VLLTRDPKHAEEKNNAANDRGPNAACGPSTCLHYVPVIRVYHAAGNVIERTSTRASSKIDGRLNLLLRRIDRDFRNA
jgi:hypothetical protein